MAFSSWRGTVGLVKPTMRPVTGGLEDLIRMLPRGIGVIPLYNNIREGSREEFKAVIAGYEAKTAELAEAGCDLIHPGGAPPFMLLGYQAERELIASWEKRFGVPIFTSGMNQSAALHALGARRIVGVSYFPGEINAIFAKYFTEAGFNVLDMVALDVPFTKVQEVSNLEVYKFIKNTYRANRGADAVYMLGPAWHSIDIVGMLEQDIGVPVLHSVPAQCWEIQKRLDIREPVAGFGRILSELP